MRHKTKVGFCFTHIFTKFITKLIKLFSQIISHYMQEGFVQLNNRGIFLTIFDGKFTQRVNEHTEGAVQRENKNHVLVYEKYFQDEFGKPLGLNARLIDITTRTHAKYGKQWEFSFEAGATKYCLQLPYSNSYATALLKMLPNIDLAQYFTMIPVSKVVEGKTQSSLIITQNGSAIKHFYTKDIPNGLPPMEKVKRNGLDAWDDSSRLEFLENMVNTDILPKIKNANAQVITSIVKDSGIDTSIDTNIDPDTFEDGSPLPEMEEGDSGFGGF